MAAVLTPPGITNTTRSLVYTTTRSAVLDWSSTSLTTTRTAQVPWAVNVSTWKLPGRTFVYVEPVMTLYSLPPRTYSIPRISTLPDVTRTVGQIWPI